MKHLIVKSEGPIKLVDYFFEHECFVWMRMEGHGIEECGEDSFGEDPKWLAIERSENPLSAMLEKEWCFGCKEDEDGWMQSHGDVIWLLHRGIAPYQPFLVRIRPPEYSKTWTDCGYEYDVEYDTEIVFVKRWKEHTILRAWNRLYSMEVEADVQLRKVIEEFRRKQRTDIDALYLQRSVYFSRHISLYDDMAMPDGVRITLCSEWCYHFQEKRKRNVGAFLISGDDDNGDWKVAMERLIKKALNLPDLTEEIIRNIRTCNSM